MNIIKRLVERVKEHYDGYNVLRYNQSIEMITITKSIIKDTLYANSSTEMFRLRRDLYHDVVTYQLDAFKYERYLSLKAQSEILKEKLAEE